MEPTIQPRSHAKDVFLNLASMVALYASAVAVLNLLFTIINTAYPKITGAYYTYSSSISLPVATLIVIFPLYILFMWLIEKNSMEGDMRIIGVRKWLTYITLFISGGLIVGDLVTILYYFLDGQEMTTGFVLKVLSILVVAGGVFGYYISDIRNTLTHQTRKLSAIVTSVCIVIAIILGFSVIGSPRTQRLMNYDALKISNLQSISNQISYYYERNKVLPSNLKVLETDPYMYMYNGTIDEQTGVPYVYRIISPTSYELCATFNFDSVTSRKTTYGVWSTYTKGESCFAQVVSPVVDQKAAPVLYQ